MNREKFSAIAHASHRVYNPVSFARWETLVALADLRPGDRVVDFGCGKAEMLLTLIERYGVRGLGIERSAFAVEAARANMAGRGEPGSLELIEADAREVALEPESFALAMVVGGGPLQEGHAGIADTLGYLRRLVRPGGKILVGEGYWKRPPAQTYLEALGASPDEMLDHAGNVAAGEQAGLIPWHAVVAGEDEWDEYEWRYSRNIEQYALTHLEDPDVPAMLERIRAWRRTYLREGRDTLGFGLYLFHRP